MILSQLDKQRGVARFPPFLSIAALFFSNKCLSDEPTSFSSLPGPNVVRTSLDLEARALGLPIQTVMDLFRQSNVDQACIQRDFHVPFYLQSGQKPLKRKVIPRSCQ